MPRRDTLKASQEGKLLINQARSQKIKQAKQKTLEKQGVLKKGWNEDDEIFLREASKILKPTQNWDNVASTKHYAVSSATWKRFKEAKDPIDRETFKGFCQMLGLNWETVADLGKDLSKAPPLCAFYGRTQELAEVQQWLIQDNCRLVVIYGVGGIGKAAFARQLVENLADKYEFTIWRSLNYTQSFQVTLTEIVQFLSKGNEDECDVSLLIKYLSQHRCLVVLEDWEEIAGSHGADYRDYCDLLKRIAREAYQSSILLLSRERPHYLEALEGRWVRFRRLGALNYEDAKEILKAEGLSSNDNDLEEFSKRYTNPWVLKRVARTIKNVNGYEVSNFLQEISVYVDDAITNFLDEQFHRLSDLEKKVIYWIAIRRNSASWQQLVQDASQSLSYDRLFYTLDSLIQRYALVDKNLEQVPILYTLDSVIMKYITNQFVKDNCQQILQVFQSQIIQGSELFISHSFITENCENKQLTQEQNKRIVKPIQEKLSAKCQSQQQFEEELKNVLTLIQKRELSAGYANQNILSLLS